ncbi:DEAD/DEAH box helicase [uncultured Ruminococcus sp.]|uniref:DEAD/DEAH box helicase n=1 Tax=uncultured Ruminococcus sp. TaxID=165186 RepID=UPI002620973B|nr:DEAD/DEAH box helicase [uncultured Ruminococcus sp.]
MGFTWVNFYPSFIKEILEASDLDKGQIEQMDYAIKYDDIDSLISVMCSVYAEPNTSLIRKHRKIVENSLLKNFKDEVEKIFKALYITGHSYNDRWLALMKKATSSSLIDAYIRAMYNISDIEVQLNEYSKFKTTVSLRMSETYAEEVPLYDFQKEAVKELTKHYITDDMDSGILVMPTGSGKSRTATYFLIKEMISRGYQILWIAHRHMLIDQAADCFYQFAGLCKINKPDIKDYRISCISGEHLSIRQVDKVEVIVASIQSICRSLDHLRRILKRGKVMVVIDECHHTEAKSYRNTLKFIRECRSKVKLLGLTATPIRSNDKETAHLLKIFDNKRIFEVAMSDLIAKKILADPQYERVETSENFEPDISYDEAKFINKYGELPDTLIHKIAVSKERNAIILKQYLDNTEKYGKTLIFALNVVHCRFLYEELSKKKVRCGLVYSGKEDNSKVINDFKDNKLDVLVNVNILTEGTDVPNIQTVFLTRPTTSEGFLMQMIGRGMRGPEAKGTKTVNIVDFHDQWDVFNKWLDPQWLIEEELEEPDEKVYEKKKREMVSYEWKACKALYRALRINAAESNCTVAVPSGWYTLMDEYGESTRMLIFEDQLVGLNRMMKDKKQWLNNPDFNAQNAIDSYFSGFCYKPDIHELELLIDNLRTLEETPKFHPLKNRAFADPRYVIERARKENRDVYATAIDMYYEHEIIRDIYEGCVGFLQEVCNFQKYGNSSVLRTRVEEMPLELIPFDMTRFYDINELFNEVKNERFQGEFNGISSISWTDKPYKTYYGVHYRKDHSIMINSILNSKDVPREVVKFVIYHEMLHRDNPFHNADFRRLEHEYPNYEECEHFLDGTMLEFDINDM